MKQFLTRWSLNHPVWVMLLVLLVTVFFGAQFPKVQFDNDPENMLSKNEFVRVFNHETKEKFGLYDFVIVGVVNDENEEGIFNPKTLQRVDKLTYQLLSLRQGEDGLPQVQLDRTSAEYTSIDLTPESGFKRVMNTIFSHDPNRLFNEDGSSSIIGRELISPSVVDNIKQADMGSLKLEYLMEHVPQTQEEANTLRDDAMNNPLYKGTLVSEDAKAICIYIPITAKPFSYNVATLVRKLTADWDGADKIYIAGLPVAEDTFGVEMLVQMSISAPAAMLILFLLMYFFFKRISLIVAPLLLAIITVIWSMGLLIGLGYDVHIMSSMIPIFIMPIAVCNSIHLLSEFFDSYRRYQNKDETLLHVVDELFMPMLYATTTTIAGFASLATTPIPPVKIFGLHVAFGVAAGWLLTMTFVPAFFKLFISEKSLHKLCEVPQHPDQCEVDTGLLGRFLNGLGRITYQRSATIVVGAVLILIFSFIGISKINVNDNPVKWFSKHHELRVADTVLNDHFGGTYTAYLTLTADPNHAMTCRDQADLMRKAAEARFRKSMPDATDSFLAELDLMEKKFNNMESSEPNRCFLDLAEAAGKIDENVTASWNTLADAINYMDPEGLTLASLSEQVGTLEEVNAKDVQILLKRLSASPDVTGMDLLDAALAICDKFTALSFRDFVINMKTEAEAPAFKRPEVLAYVDRLQQHLMANEKVGKTSSAVDALKKASYELRYQQVSDDLSPEESAALHASNESNFAVPETASIAGQVYIQLEGMKKKDTLFHLVTRDFNEANIWVQLTSGDNQDMTRVVADVDRFVAENPPPMPLSIAWAGLTYLNVVWQEKMVVGMLSSLVSSFVVVLVMMLVLFRSPRFGLLAMIPLTVTISFIYGLIGWFGKDYDMPVAILSAMTLGLSVDFAIHFLERGREMYKGIGSWKETNQRMFGDPAKAISRNAIVIALGFTPLLLAPLVPYRTVGLFLAMIMLTSWLATLFILPALLKLMEKSLFPKKDEE